MSLEKFRRKIDTADREIIKLISKRMKISLAIGNYKKKHGMKIFDKKREEKLFADIRKIARKSGLDEKTAEKIFRIIVKESRSIQKKHRGGTT